MSAAAERAGGERERRRRRPTPLIEQVEPDEPGRSAEPDEKEPEQSRPGRPRLRPVPSEGFGPAPRRGASGRSAALGRPAGQGDGPDLADVLAGGLVDDPPAGAPGDPLGPGPGQQPGPDRSAPRRGAARASEEAQPFAVLDGGAGTGPLDGLDLVEAGEALAALLARVASSTLGPDWDSRAAELLAFLRRRLTGDYEVDDFGFDPDLTEHLLLGLVRPLYRSWFRVEVRGVENVPDEGGALVVANHSGTLPLDAFMTQLALHDEHPAHRQLRTLGADLLFRTPILGELARKGGSTLACNEDAERLLASGEVVGVWPEGYKGLGKPFSERYKLQRFGRGGFVSAALRTGVPIVPVAIVGAEEIYPMLGNMPTVARLLGLPYLPITPLFPWLGLLGLLPLPSKWVIEFGEPIPTQDLAEGSAEDPMLVFDLTDRVRETIQHTLYSLLMGRRSVFF